MNKEKTKELYVAPRITCESLDHGQSILISFSLEGSIEDIAEDDTEW